LHGRQIFYQGEQIIPTYTKNAAKPPIIDVRTISTFLPRYGSHPLDKALDVIDDIFNFSCFAEPVERNAPQAMAPVITLLQKQELSQEQRQELRQALNQIQVPKLIMSMQITPYLTARTAYKSRVLKMSQEELDRHIKKALG